MAIATLRDLYQLELENLYDAERQIVNALPKLRAAADADDLRLAFDKHLERTKIHLERLDLVFSRLGTTRREGGGSSKRSGVAGRPIRNRSRPPRMSPCRRT